MLPAELMLDIIEYAGAMADDSTFRRPAEIQQTLLNLSLVNHAFRQWADRVLLERVYLSSSQQLIQFREFVCTNKWSGYRPRIRHVKSLAITGISIEDIQVGNGKDIVPVLLTLAPTLERLMLDLPIRNLTSSDPALRKISMDFPRVLKRLTNLRQFVSTRDELDVGGSSCVRAWSEWGGLQKLAVYNADMDDAFVDAVARVQGLTHLAVVNPCAVYDSEECSPFATILDACPAIQNLTLVRVVEHVGNPDGAASAWWKFVEDPKMKDYMKRITLVEIDDLSGAEHFAGSTKWMKECNASGALWNCPTGKIII